MRKLPRPCPSRTRPVSSSAAPRISGHFRHLKSDIENPRPSENPSKDSYDSRGGISNARASESQADARGELEVVARRGRDGPGGRGGYAAARVAPSVVYERVAEVEAREDSARRVELKHAAEVCGEVGA